MKICPISYQNSTNFSGLQKWRERREARRAEAAKRKEECRQLQADLAENRKHYLAAYNMRQLKEQINIIRNSLDIETDKRVAELETKYVEELCIYCGENCEPNLSEEQILKDAEKGEIIVQQEQAQRLLAQQYQPSLSACPYFYFDFSGGIPYC